MTTTTARRGRPQIGTRVYTILPPDVLDIVDFEAQAHNVPRSELLRGIVTEWVHNGGYDRPDPGHFAF